METIKKEISDLHAEIKMKTIAWNRWMVELYEKLDAKMGEPKEEKLSGLDFFDSLRSIEPEKIVVCGLCDENGFSHLWRGIPTINKYGGLWLDGGSLLLEQNDLFPKDKPQKYKLVPIEEND